MKLIIRDDGERASAYVAEYIISRIKAFAPTPSKPFVLGLPTGSSPEIVYRILVERHRAGEISFKNVVTFNMDEYVGLPQSHPESYHSFMWKHFFSHVDVNPTNVHILDGNAPDLKTECNLYEQKIKQAGGIDLFLGGVGADGHIAFNEPGSSLTSRTRVMPLTYDTIAANSRFFGNDIRKVPKNAVTVGVQTVLDAREVVIIVTGAHKSIAIQRCVEGGVNQMWTLSALQLHPNAMIVVDEDATLELQVKTVRYFKRVEDNTDPLEEITRTSEATEAQVFVQAPSPTSPVPPNLNLRRTLPPSPPTPLLTPELTIDNMHSRTSNYEASSPFLLPGETPSRASTPEFVPDRMASRMPIAV